MTTQLEKGTTEWKRRTLISLRQAFNSRYFLLFAISCFLVYFLQILNPDLTFLLGLKANIFFKRPWTIFSSFFVHSLKDPMHLLNNMFFLLLFGYMLEREIGSYHFAVLYLTSGLFANLSAFVFYSNSLVIGASGSISAVVVAMATIKPRTMGFAYGAVMPMWAVGALWFISNYFLVVAEVEGIAAAAHLFGAAFGLFAGLYFRKIYQFSEEEDKEEEEIEDESIDQWEEEYM